MKKERVKTLVNRMGGRAFVYYYDTYMKDKNADVDNFANFVLN